MSVLQKGMGKVKAIITEVVWHAQHSHQTHSLLLWNTFMMIPIITRPLLGWLCKWDSFKGKQRKSYSHFHREFAAEDKIGDLKKIHNDLSHKLMAQIWPELTSFNDQSFQSSVEDWLQPCNLLLCYKLEHVWGVIQLVQLLAPPTVLLSPSLRMA